MNPVVAMRLRENCFKGLMYLSLFSVLSIKSCIAPDTTSGHGTGIKGTVHMKTETKSVTIKKR